MKIRLHIILFAALLLATSCDQEGKDRLDALQSEADQIAGQMSATDSPSVEVDVPGDEPYAFAFDRPRYGVDAAGSVTIKYSLPKPSTVEVFAKDGWSAEVNAISDTQGEIVVTCPDPAVGSELVAVATDQNGHSVAVPLNIIVRDPYTDETRTTICTMGYYGFKPGVAKLENFQKLAEAGIDAITVEADEPDYMDQLDMAYQAGVKCVPVIMYYTERYSIYGDDYKGLEEIITKLKNHPATMAYHIWDEPSTKNIPTIKMQKEKIEELDPDHPVYVNLNPDGSPGALGVDYYHDYIEAFVRDCKVKFLSFDMYPMRPETDPDYPDGIVGYWYQCLEAVSSITKQYGIPFWAFAASCWINKEQNLFAKPTVANLRMQAYTNMAYGAQVQQYFTIMQYGGTDYAPISYDGSWTGAYDTLKEFNLELRKRGYIFDGCKMDRVRYTNVVPFFCQRLADKDLPPQIATLTTAGDALVSFIENRGNQYVVVCNRSYKDENTLSLDLNDMVYVIDREGNFIECAAGTSTFEMEAGDMLVIKIK